MMNMRRIRRRRLRNKMNIRTGILILVLLVIFVILLRATWHLYNIVRDTAQKRTIAEENAIELKERRSELEEKIERAGTQRGIEEEIRDRYAVVKEGEGVIIIINEEEETFDSKDDEEKGFWSQLFGELDYW